MIIKLKNTDSFGTSIFGGVCPYWIKQSSGEVIISDCFDTIISLLPINKRIIDPVGIASLLQFNYIHGDRTLINGINRLPWRSTINAQGDIIRTPALNHGNNKLEPRLIAKFLKILLLEELTEYTKNHTNVYLLLSGGLDSRITAGLLKIIQKEISLNVTAISWGSEISRDVIYAKRIADLYGWKFIHISLSSKLLEKNICESIRYGGGEVAGIHFHGMSELSFLSKNDLVLATSFGDSIGRGEFSGKNLMDISLPRFYNNRDLLFSDIFAKSYPQLIKDRNRAFSLSDANKEWIQCELDLQENYMRRMIVQSMGYISQYAELKQLFTSSNVLKFIWSLDPRFRNDQIYRELFKIIDIELCSIPWARTGIALDGTIETNEQYSKDFHTYNDWLRKDLHSLLNRLINHGNLIDLNIFNRSMLNQLWFDWENNERMNSEIILKVAQIEMLRDIYSINGVDRKIFGRLFNATFDLNRKLFKTAISPHW